MTSFSRKCQCHWKDNVSRVATDAHTPRRDTAFPCVASVIDKRSQSYSHFFAWSLFEHQSMAQAINPRRKGPHSIRFFNHPCAKSVLSSSFTLARRRQRTGLSAWVHMRQDAVSSSGHPSLRAPCPMLQLPPMFEFLLVGRTCCETTWLKCDQ